MGTYIEDTVKVWGNLEKRRVSPCSVSQGQLMRTPLCRLFTSVALCHALMTSNDTHSFASSEEAINKPFLRHARPLLSNSCLRHGDQITRQADIDAMNSLLAGVRVVHVLSDVCVRERECVCVCACVCACVGVCLWLGRKQQKAGTSHEDPPASQGVAAM